MNMMETHTLLGMRHMADKSAQNCLDTLKEILSDINDTCQYYKILAKIKSTMSERAATETKFHRLVDSYRREILPLYHDQWAVLDLAHAHMHRCMSIFPSACRL